MGQLLKTKEGVKFMLNGIEKVPQQATLYLIYDATRLKIIHELKVIKCMNGNVTQALFIQHFEMLHIRHWSWLLI